MDNITKKPVILESDIHWFCQHCLLDFASSYQRNGVTEVRQEKRLEFVCPECRLQSTITFTATEWIIYDTKSKGLR